METLKTLVLWFRSLSWTGFCKSCVNLYYRIVKRKGTFSENEPEVIIEEFEIIPKTTIIEEKEEEEKENCPINPEDFVVDRDEDNLFHNLKNKDCSIRIMKSCIKEKGKDNLVFATSLPHKFSGSTFKSLINCVPELTHVDFSKSHELLITKSPASKFESVQDRILKFIFLHLDGEYGWLHEEQVVLIEEVKNPEILSFNLRVQTCNHLELGYAMFEISGITAPLFGKRLPLCMDHCNTYDFTLNKGKAFTWEELLPKIKKVFADHFTGGVKFVGYMQ